MASAVDSRLAYARLSAVATASRLPTATRDSNNSYTTSWDTTGAKPAERNPLDAKVRALEAQVARLEHELHTAHTILDVQGKVAGLLGLNLEHGTRS